MLKKMLVVVICVSFLAAILPQKACSQSDESFRMQLESILYSFKNYRFSTISIYKLKDKKDIVKIIKRRDEAASTGEEGASTTNTVDVTKMGVELAVLQSIEKDVNAGLTESKIKRNLDDNSLPIPEDAKFKTIYNYYKSKIKIGKTRQVQDVYVVTTRKDKETLVPNTIIGVIMSYVEDGTYVTLKNKLNMPSPTNIYTYPELKEFPLDPKEFSSNNLYGLIENSFLQGNVQDVTLEAKGIGTIINFFPAQAGVTRSLIQTEAVISSYDVQKFKRISEGQPLDITDKLNEVIISPDLISWKRFSYILQDNGSTDSEGRISYDTLGRITNLAPPKFGIELKYGLDAINYPSFWSERMTLSAVWQGVKLGIVLPTNGYSSVTKDVLNVERKLTYAGVGIAGEADFPMAIIPKSGIFQGNFSYVFGDAKEGPIQRNLDPDTYTTNSTDLDHIIRFHAQLHYTFGVAIDYDYMLRFGLGGTIYTAENWYNKSKENPETRSNEISYQMYNSESIGGVSGKIEFMARNVATPYGAVLQYFDEGIYTNVWLQVPIVENTFALRIDAKGYFKAFADQPRAWESKSVFIPMARFIVNF
jgi:hypothetical protein